MITKTPLLGKLFLLLAVFYSSTIISQTIITVTPCNMNGWVKEEPVPSRVYFVNGPSTAPLQRGSLQMSAPVFGAGKFARLRNTQYSGTLLSSLTELKYSTYVQQAESNFDVPFVVLQIDNNEDGVVDNPIVFVPKFQSGNYITGPQLPNQGAVAKNVWQTWDALHGGWWTGPTNNPDQGGALYKLSTYISLHPLARILNTSSTIGGIRLNAGGPAFANNFLGNADAFIIGVNGNSKIFDFELGIYAGQNQSIVYGYGSNCTTLSGNAYSGVAPFQYSWSNDLMVLSNTKDIIVCPTDTTTYTLTVTDVNGCVRTDQVTVFVNDVRCGNEMDKVMVCHNGQTICISPDAVHAHLNHGDYLGNCSNSTQITSLNAKAFITAKETIQSDKSQPGEFKLSNYPNPFVNVTTIQYELPLDCLVSIKVYDQSGRLVSMPVSGNKKAGLYSFSFNGNNLSAGLYSYRMEATGGIKTFTKTNKIIIVH